MKNHKFTMVRSKVTQKRYYESGSEEESEDDYASRPPAKKKGKRFPAFFPGWNFGYLNFGGCKWEVSQKLGIIATVTPFSSL